MLRRFASKATSEPSHWFVLFSCDFVDRLCFSGHGAIHVVQRNSHNTRIPQSIFDAKSRYVGALKLVQKPPPLVHRSRSLELRSQLRPQVAKLALVPFPMIGRIDAIGG